MSGRWKTVFKCDMETQVSSVRVPVFDDVCYSNCIICFVKQDNQLNVCRTEDFQFPAGIYLFKVNNRNTRTTCEICSKLTIKTPERCYWRSSGVFIVNFEHISYLVLVFLLLTLSK